MCVQPPSVHSRKQCIKVNGYRDRTACRFQTTTGDEYVIIMHPLHIFTQLSQMCTNSVSLIKEDADEDVVKDVLSCLSTRSANSHATVTQACRWRDYQISPTLARRNVRLDHRLRKKRGVEGGGG